MYMMCTELHDVSIYGNHLLLHPRSESSILAKTMGDKKEARKKTSTSRKGKNGMEKVVGGWRVFSGSDLALRRLGRISSMTFVETERRRKGGLGGETGLFNVRAFGPG
ncbi:hypothetical protein H0G86_004759 [Trichoderma simmonsii]|uniref:Uncharacterized protein n=1 Tax=Trichoderma simmonsii TaxID=1491479 RepID=A0A8G0PCD8_9HYPO|nr:hypothetical protein H0G86_004759 [Trichoderma simmonsii]